MITMLARFVSFSVDWCNMRTIRIILAYSTLTELVYNSTTNHDDDDNNSNNNITYIYNTLNDALSAYRIHNKLKTILLSLIHI